MDNDISEQLLEQVQDAVDKKTNLEIIGGGSKQFYGRPVANPNVMLSTSEHQGIVNYEPTELVITARAGTTIKAINQILSENNQALSFEPPSLNGRATLGGTLACGFSGPVRPYAGAARDFVLGTHIINGKGQLLKFGGEVMKNVAGYDVSRAMVGAMGTLGVITQASLKVLPVSNTMVTCTFALNHEKAKETMRQLRTENLPASAMCFSDEMLYVRLSGSASNVDVSKKKLGGEYLKEADAFWHDLTNFELPVFKTNLPLWRISIPVGSDLKLPQSELNKALIDWGSALWWLPTELSASDVRLAATKAGGHAVLFSGGDRHGDIFHPFSKNMLALQQRIKNAFDPNGILNPGRMFTEF